MHSLYKEGMRLIMDNHTNIAPVNKDLNIVKYETINIKNLIYTIRGKQVMLDSDVAILYHYQTKRINETVSRNKERFPENFCFQLTEIEIENLKSQIVVSNVEQENNWPQTTTTSECEDIRSQFATE